MLASSLIACTCVGASFASPPTGSVGVPTQTRVGLLTAIGARPLLLGDGVVFALTTSADPFDPELEFHILTPARELTAATAYQVIDGASNAVLTRFTTGTNGAVSQPTALSVSIHAEVLAAQCADDCMNSDQAPSGLQLSVVGGEGAAWLEVALEVNGVAGEGAELLRFPPSSTIELGGVSCSRRGPSPGEGDSVCATVSAVSADGSRAVANVVCTTVVSCPSSAECVLAPACGHDGAEGCASAPTPAGSHWLWPLLLLAAAVTLGRFRSLQVESDPV